MMSMDDYQKRAQSFRAPDVPPEERVFGLLEEVGEIAAIYKRIFRGDWKNSTEDVAASKLFKELGDVLWYVSQVALDNGFSLSEIAVANINKLEDRLKRQTLIGEGDNR